MHKGVVLLMKAGDREGARAKACAFMEPYNENTRKKCGVWDWYIIGGRWSGTLNPLNKGFDEAARKIVPPDKCGFITTADVDRAQPELQAAWKALGGKGANPWGRNQYSKEPDADDILPLAECGSVIKEWAQRPISSAIRKLREVLKRQVKKNIIAAWKDRWMWGYWLREVLNLLFSRFSFEANIYNTERRNFSVPGDRSGWYAVMVDMHS